MLICIACVKARVYSKCFNYKEFLKKGVSVVGTVGKNISPKQNLKNLAVSSLVVSLELTGFFYQPPTKHVRYFAHKSRLVFS